MQTRNLLLGLLGALLCGGLAWSFFATDDPVPVETLSGPETDLAEETDTVRAVSGGTGAAAPRTELDGPHADANAADAREIQVSGRVLGDAGRPLPGARITLEFNNRAGQRHGPPQAIESGADGTFVIAKEGFTDARVRLAVTHERYAPQLIERRAGRSDGGAIVVGDVQLTFGGGLSGSVTTFDNAPIPGATIRVRPGSGHPLRRVPHLGLLPDLRTDANGWFEIARLHPGTYRIEASAPDYERKTTDELTVAEGRTTEVVPIHLGPGFTIAGTVHDSAGAPVAAALVHVTTQRGRAAQTRTDDAGRFSIEHLNEAELRLSTRRSGFVTDRRDVDARQSGARRIAIQLVGGLRITGVVRDASTGAVVTRYAARARRVRDLPKGESAADPLVRIDALEARLRAAQQALNARVAEMRKDPALGQRVSQLQNHLQVLRQQAELDALSARRVSRDGWVGRSGSLGPPADHPDGRFAVTGLDEGVYVVDVDSPEHQRLTGEPIELRAGGAAPDLTLTVRAGLSVTGTVTSKSGAPLSDTRVDLLAVTDTRPNTGNRSRIGRLWNNTARGRSIDSTQADVDGRFRFEHAPPGRYAVRASASRHARATSEPFELRSATVDVKLALDGLARLSGKVSGIPPGNEADVRLTALSPGGRNKSGSVAADGTYELDGLEPGGYFVRAYLGSQRSALSQQLRDIDRGQLQQFDITLRSGDDARLDLTLSRAETGTVVGQLTHNGAPSNRFRLSLHPVENPDGQRRRTTRTRARADGSFRFADVSTGRYEFRVSDGRAVAQRAIVFVELDRETRHDVRIDTGSLVGRVTASDAEAGTLNGAAVLFAGARTLPSDEARHSREHPTYTVRVRAGTFEHQHLVAGSYLLSLRIEGREPVEHSLYIVAGSTERLAIQAGAKTEGQR